jgi:hypothetical protein
MAQKKNNLKDHIIIDHSALKKVEEMLKDAIYHRKAKYKLIYWNEVIYFERLKDAQKLRDSLPYYQQEDSMILRIKK